MKVNADQQKYLSSIAIVFGAHPRRALAVVDMLDENSLPNLEGSSDVNHDDIKLKIIGRQFVYNNGQGNQHLIFPAGSLALQILKRTLTSPSEIEAEVESLIGKNDELQALL